MAQQYMTYFAMEPNLKAESQKLANISDYEANYRGRRGHMARILVVSKQTLLHSKKGQIQDKTW